MGLLLLVNRLVSCDNLELKLRYLNTLIPQHTDLRARVLTTISCADCDYLPKVENAGHLFKLDNCSNYQLMHNGLKILQNCYYGEWMTTIIEILKGHHEPQEEKAFHEVLKYLPDGSLMIELGSYWGYYSMWFAQVIKEAKNYLIEPDPENLKIGEKNFALNKIQGHFTNAMLGDCSQDSARFVDWDYNEHHVNQIALDDFAREHDISFIHILHSDIQGAEVDMLKGCSQLIDQHRIGYFFISTHRGKHDECLRILQGANLDILVSINRDESFSADGLIVAKLPEINGPQFVDLSRRTDKFCKLLNKISNN